MKKLLCYTSILLSLILNACIEDCPDKNYHQFTETDLDWYSYQPGDTLHFIDQEHNKRYYMTCRSTTSNIDSTFNEDHYCKDGGYYQMFYSMTTEMVTNFPHKSDDLLSIKMKIDSKGKTMSLITWKLFNSEEINTYNYYEYFFEFDNQSESIANVYSGGSWAIYNEQANIYGTIYNDVYDVVAYENEGLLENAFYDRIYYSKEGFLKFISSKNNIVLERTPD